MSTNYYAFDAPTCEHCGRSGEPIHIGNVKKGWAFALHVIPEMNLNSLADWKEYLEGKHIEDEYERALLLYELMDLIENRKDDPDREPHERYDDWAHFHQMNQSELDPGNGLLRDKTKYCVGHGNAWDLVTGDFG